MFKLACLNSNVQFNDTVYFLKTDTQLDMMQQMVSDGNIVKKFCLSANGRELPVIFKGVEYNFTSSNGNNIDEAYRKMLDKVKLFNPDILLLKDFASKLNIMATRQFPNVLKLLIFIGGELIPPKFDVDYVMVASDGMKNELINQNYNSEKIISCAFSCNHNFFIPSNIKKKYDIIYCADWREIKRQHILIEVLKDYPELNICFIGDQTGKYSSTYFEKCIRQSINYGVLDRMILINRLPGNEIVEYYNRSRIGIHLGMRTEGGARAVMEYMSCELPVIVVNDCLSNISRVDNNINGLHCEPKTSSIIDSIKYLLSNPKIMKAMGKEGRRKVIKEWPADRMKNDIEGCIKAFMSKKENSSNIKQDLKVNVNHKIDKANKIKKVYLFGYFGIGALADDALLLSTERLINSIDENIIIHHTINKNLKNMTCEEITKMFNKEYDLIIFCGGTWLKDYPGVEYARDVTKWHDDLKTPYILFGPGWRLELNHSIDKKGIDVCKLLIDKSYKTGLRGHLSRKDMIDFGFDKNKLEIVGDPIFSLSFNEKEIEQAANYMKPMKYPLIAGNIRTMQEAERLQCNSHFDKKIHDWFHLIWNHFVNKKFNFIGFGLGSSSKKEKSDNDTINDITKTFKKPKERNIYQNCNLDLMSLLNSIRYCSLSLGSRLHFQMVSILQGVKIIPIEYEFNKLRDCLSVHKNFDEYNRYIISMDQNNELPSVNDVWDIYCNIDKLDANKIKIGVEQIRSYQKGWLKNILDSI